MTTLKKVAAFLTIFFAAVILFLASSGSFSESKNENSAVERARYTHKTLPSSVINQVIISTKIKDFAVDRPMKEPSHWIRFANRKLDEAPTLSKDDIGRIEKFVMFIGYPRSGHSIVGSLMDAHPHMVIANEFMLFKNWKYFSDREKEDGERNPFYKNKYYLFNSLYKRSYWDTTSGLRNDQNAIKNYTLSMDSSLWQGKFDKYISVIGDKSGGGTAATYLNSKSTFTRYLEELKTTVEIPIKGVHVIRNPFDQISTCVLYKDHNRLSSYTELALTDGVSTGEINKHQSKPAAVSQYKSAMTALQEKGDNETFEAAKYESDKRLDYCIDRLVKRASAVARIMELIGPSNVIDIHNTDLVNDPKVAIGTLCSSLEVECTPEYLEACANKVFKSVSRTRDMLLWSPKMIAKVEEEVIQTYPFFNRYSFESE